MGRAPQKRVLLFGFVPWSVVHTLLPSFEVALARQNAADRCETGKSANKYVESVDVVLLTPYKFHQFSSAFF